ncbi:hypothetical protein SDC9_171205 [bioreactor metagenome]|uniref:Uncharacterized protein n=1 Tax=bioreactor metagenome TaxID=1076179 RepID=A0A645GCT9_9ZZZZ
MRYVTLTNRSQGQFTGAVAQRLVPGGDAVRIQKAVEQQGLFIAGVLALVVVLQYQLVDVIAHGD